MDLISWNINSLRSVLTGNSSRAQQSREVLKEMVAVAPEIIAFQETKLPSNQLTKAMQQGLEQLFPNYEPIIRSSTPPAKTSYSGVMFLIKKGLHPVIKMPNLRLPVPSVLNHQVRIITLEFAHTFLVQAYIPHYQWHQLDLHFQWMKELSNYLEQLVNQKPVIACGDFGIIPVNAASNRGHQKQLVEGELAAFDHLLNVGFVDTFAIGHGGNAEATWWPNQGLKRSDHGLRMDFWLVSDSLTSQVQNCSIMDTGKRRDHAPVKLEINCKL